MATTMMRLAPQRVAGWNTLRLLRMGRTMILLLDALLLVAILSTTQAHRSALKTVGKDAAPSIIAAQHIKAAMADMDADAANELLATNVSQDSTKPYEARRLEASDALITAAENITYGDAERLPIETLQLGLGSYERLVQEARDLHENGSGRMVNAYRDAAALMDGTLLPAADALDTANNDVLERTYEAQNRRSAGTRLTIVFAGLLMAAALLGMQILLSHRMHRTFNPLLLVATLCGVVFAAHVVSATTESHQQLKVAKEDAFASIHALWRARATAYQANSEESRFLLDTAHAEGHAEAFGREADALLQFDSRLTSAELGDALRGRVEVAGLHGLLADEVHNITFSGEREAAVDTITAWQQYRALDPQIRTLERTGQHKAAVALCAGQAPGQSDWAFAQFDGALDRALAINQSAFGRAVDRGFGALEHLEIEAGVGCVLIAVLVFFGFAPRIREYV